MDKEKRAAMRKLAEPVKGWSNCNRAWLDPSGDDQAAVVGHIDDDGNDYPVATIDCGQYYQGQDSIPLAKFYAAANPSAILQLLDYVETMEKDAARYQALKNKDFCIEKFVSHSDAWKAIESGRLDEVIDASMQGETE